MKYLTIAVTALLLAGCKSDPRREANANAFGGHLSFTEKGIVSTFFPHSITETTSSRIIDQIYDGLVMFDAVTMEVRPCIARSWKVSGNGLEYRFTLRNDVYFHDDECFEKGNGRKVKAQDFVYSFSLLSTPDENNKNFSTFVDIVEGAQDYYLKGGITKSGNILSGVIAENDSTLTIKLIKSSGIFLYNLAGPVASVIPEEGYKKYGYRNAIGCGPFCISNINEKDNIISLMRFPYYYMKDLAGNFYPYADSVTIYLASPLNKSFNLLDKGKIHFIQNVPGGDLAGFLEKNINRFQSKDPEFVAQVSQALPEWQDILSTKLANYHSNNISMLPLYQMYVKK